MPADKPIIKDLTSGLPSETSSSSSGGKARLTQNGLLVLGPHNEGAKVVLVCESQGGYPEPQLSWWRNGQLIDDSYEIVSSLDGLILGQHVGGALTSGLSEAQSSESQPDRSESSDNNELLADANLLEPQPSDAGGGEQQQVVTQNKPMGPGNNRLIRNKLELNGLTRADLMANYSCQAWNTKLSEAPTTSVMIDMNRK